MEIFTVRQLSFRYPEGKQDVLSDITFSVHSGEFVTVCGLSGCGKSTLLRHLKTCLRPIGAGSGEILFEGKALAEWDQRIQAEKIGFVMQSPDHQSVTDKVWHELAFGLESLGLPRAEIRRRTAEMAAFFGMESWFEESVEHLSGGQRQMLNLASVMVMQPSVLILDEPLAQLDPIAAGEFLNLLRKIHREFATTIILSEHSLNEIWPVSDRILVLSHGKLLSDTEPRKTSRMLYRHRDAMFLSMPAAARIYEQMTDHKDHFGVGVSPLSVGEGREWLQTWLKEHPARPLPEQEPSGGKKKLLELRNLWFRYEKSGKDILKGLDLTVSEGEFLTILGGNGAGKTTLFSILAGLEKPVRGDIMILQKNVRVIRPREQGIALLPQNPQLLFVRQTVREDLYELLEGSGLTEEDQERRFRRVVGLCELKDLLEQHPYDLSGGEQQKAALAKVLLTEPKLLLLDEPAKGLDMAFQYQLSRIIRQLTDGGTTVIAVSHDIEFCAAFADRCAMLFNGVIVSEGKPSVFFSQNHSYTTAVCRMTKGLLQGTVTVSDVLSSFGITQGEEAFRHQTLPPGPEPPSSGTADLPETSSPSVQKKHRFSGILNNCLKLLAGLAFLLSLLITAEIIPCPVLTERKWLSYGIVFGTAIVGMIAAGSGSRKIPVFRRKGNPWRMLLCLGVIFALVPLTVLAGVYLFHDTKYLFIALLVMLESTVPFYLMLERRSLQARELVLLAVLCALCVSGRAVFYMLPQFKPVTALVILSAVSLGSESGFLIGSVSMLVSNVFFGQGIWTPWQMFAMGLIGFLAGIVFHLTRLQVNRVSLSIFGFLAALVLYGGIMNPATLLMSQTPLTTGALLSVYWFGLPVDTIHAVSTAWFLWIAAEPMLSKLERIKKKYGLIR